MLFFGLCIASSVTHTLTWIVDPLFRMVKYIGQVRARIPCALSRVTNATWYNAMEFAHGGLTHLIFLATCIIIIILCFQASRTLLRSTSIWFRGQWTTLAGSRPRCLGGRIRPAAPRTSRCETSRPGVRPYAPIILTPCPYDPITTWGTAVRLRPLYFAVWHHIFCSMR